MSRFKKSLNILRPFFIYENTFISLESSMTHQVARCILTKIPEVVLVRIFDCLLFKEIAALYSSSCNKQARESIHRIIIAYRLRDRPLLPLAMSRRLCFYLPTPLDLILSRCRLYMRYIEWLRAEVMRPNDRVGGQSVLLHCK